MTDPRAVRDNEIRQAKEQIRKTMLARRSAVDPAVLADLSESISMRLESLPLWRDSRFPCIYISNKPGEVETHGLIRRALVSGKRVAAPITRPGNPELEIVEVLDLERLVPGHFGLLDPAPESRAPLAAPEWDLVVAPGVAFDRRGRRIGFGRGYYDRLLIRSQAPAVGLAFSFQVLREFETLSHDIDMECVVTESETIFTAR